MKVQVNLTPINKPIPLVITCGGFVVHNLEAQVFQAGRSLNLVLLDYPASFPSDLDVFPRLHPLFVYIQVSRSTVSVCVV